MNQENILAENLIGLVPTGYLGTVFKKQLVIRKVVDFINRKRGLENVNGGYSGWSVGNVSNPADAAFVICGVSSPGGSGSSGKRTNFREWSRKYK